LITTLRSHLTRLTEELSSHHQLLLDLRCLRDSDRKSLKAKSLEIDKLRREVERLGGEVEVLRAVVEEGLRERRQVREQQPLSDGLHQDTTQRLVQEAQDQDIPKGEPETHASTSCQGEAVASTFRCQERDRTAMIDHHDQGLWNVAPVIFRGDERRHSKHTIDSGVDELMSDRSARGLHARSRSRARARTQSPSQAGIRPSNKSNEIECAAKAVLAADAANPVLPSLPPTGADLHQVVRDLPQVSVPEHSTSPQSQAANGRPVSSPFPQIRGNRLERLFFSGLMRCPSCPVCTCRRRQYSAVSQRLPCLSRFKLGEERPPDHEDEGFVDGSGEEQHVPQGSCNKRKQNESKHKEPADLPPQTVLARVVRELEDDFTHYKALVEFF
jgi:Centrosome localisation domain of PPC89